MARRHAARGWLFEAIARLVRRGDRAELDAATRRAFAATNFASLGLLVLVFPCIILFIAFGQALLAGLAVLASASFAATVFLMGRRADVAARLLLVGSFNGHLFVLTLFLGPRSHLDTAFIASLALALVIFQGQRARFIALSAGLSICAYGLLHAGAHTWVTPLPLTPSEFDLFNEAVVPVVAALVLIPIALLLRMQADTERDLEADLAARRRAEEEVRQLAARESASLEDERRRLAHVLHDGAGQTLVAADLWARALVRHAVPAQEVGFTKLRQLLADVQIELRELSYDLRPAALDALGLDGALRELVDQYSTGHCVITLVSDVRPSLEVPDDVGITLYRVAQAALANVLRHAGARRAEVRLVVERDAVELMVEDDGVGFDPGAAVARRGLGLIAMRERTTWLGGGVIVRSKPGAGTTIAVRVPLPAVLEDPPR